MEYHLHKGLPCKGFDADPVNASLATVEALNVERIDLIGEDGQIAARRFDALVEKLFALKKTDVVIDTGASSFLPMIGYMAENDVVATMADEGYDVCIHSIVTGGPSMNDTQTRFRALAERFGSEARICLWTNAYFGPLCTEGSFQDSAFVRGLQEDGLIDGLISIERMSRLKQEDFENHLASNLPFTEALDGARTMVRSRLGKVHADFMRIMDAVLGDEEDKAA